ncbi:protein translocase subunit SecD [Balneatrix alpica]|uniref:Protein translocase subunit SecD n=1 Tax=Balneatrix alpica TaxID=75684 RepID=A0ABV5ZE17_9GAMM|nr:protein translocase subunit SecD [Balneatrix alpica]
MLNRYPLWKYILILVVLCVAGLYAAPNLYPDDYAIQISASRSGQQVDERALKQVETALTAQGLELKGSEATVDGQSLLVRLRNSEDQLLARDLAAKALGQNYVVALNLAPTTPQWLVDLGAGPMKLGLDLRGGVHFLMEVDMAQAVSQRLDIYVAEIKTKLRDAKLRYRSVSHNESDGSLQIRFRDQADRDEAIKLLNKDYSEFLVSAVESEDFELNVTLNEQKVREIEDYAIQQNLTTIRNRVNELGVAEPLVQRQGRNRIVVQLPGVQDTAAAKRVLGATANLEFRLEATLDAAPGTTERFPFRANPNQESLLERDIIITGNNVSSASSSFDENGQSQVNVNLDSAGGKLMNRVTRNAVKRRMAVLFIEHKTRTEQVVENGELIDKRIPYVEKSIISLATIQTALGNSFRITGLDSAAEASELALLLRAGSLAAPVYIVEERTVGPSLGQKNIEMGFMSAQIGLALVVFFMFVFYRTFGLIANVALLVNIAILISVMSMLSFTLTLPGIAGIVLTIGMAVDANVLIFSRIKEELQNKAPVQLAIHAGFERAFTTILDSNLTTLLVGVILFALGSGPVKGFAVTLSIGILTSMFTALVVGRALINLSFGGRKLNDLPIWPVFSKGVR